VAIVLVLVSVLAHPRALMVIAGLYLLWGPAVWFAGWISRGRGAPRADLGEAPAEEVADAAPHR